MMKKTVKIKPPPDVQEQAPVARAAPVATTVSADIIPDGDYAGMTYDEVMRLTSDAIDDAYANLSIQGVCAVHDMKLRDIMEIVYHYEGSGAAHEAAIRFGQTLMPYLDSPTPAISKAYKELVKMRSEWEREEQ